MIARRSAQHVSGEGGFTLVEALLSLVVLGVALVPLMNLFAQAAERHALPDELVASGLAAAKMEELVAKRALEGWTNFMTSTTDQDNWVNVDATNFPGYQWKWEVVRVGQDNFGGGGVGEGNSTRFKRVTVFVKKPDANEFKLVTIVSDY